MISILSIVHNNHCNVIIGVFVQFLVFYLLIMSSLVEPLTMHRGAQWLRGIPVGKHCSRVQEATVIKETASFIKFVVIGKTITRTKRCNFNGSLLNGIYLSNLISYCVYKIHVLCWIS